MFNLFLYIGYFGGKEAPLARVLVREFDAPLPRVGDTFIFNNAKNPDAIPESNEVNSVQYVYTGDRPAADSVRVVMEGLRCGSRASVNKAAAKFIDNFGFRVDPTVTALVQKHMEEDMKHGAATVRMRIFDLGGPGGSVDECPDCGGPVCPDCADGPCPHGAPDEDDTGEGHGPH